MARAGPLFGLDGARNFVETGRGRSMEAIVMIMPIFSKCENCTEVILEAR